MKNKTVLFLLSSFSISVNNIYGSHPHACQDSLTVTCNNPRWYGFAETQGHRPTMEDAHCLEISDDHVFAGLYDGHGGRNVADFAAQRLYKNLDLAGSKNPAGIYQALHEAFIKTHQALDAVSFDAKKQGCTAIAALIKNGTIYVANAGDSRAVLSNAGKAVALSEDHKPDRLSERQRIEQLGGHVIVYDGAPRVSGRLAVARALGDIALNPYVIPTPEIREKTLTRSDDFLILACDGVWDVIDNQTAVDIVKNSLDHSRTDVNKAADRLKSEAFKRGSTDNISVMIIDLKELLKSRNAN